MEALVYSVSPTLRPATADPHLCRRLLDTHGQLWVSLLWGHCSFPLGPHAHKVLFMPSNVHLIRWTLKLLPFPYCQIISWSDVPFSILTPFTHFCSPKTGTSLYASSYHTRLFGITHLPTYDLLGSVLFSPLFHILSSVSGLHSTYSMDIFRN